MNELALSARVVLAIVFGVAASAKLFDLESARRTVEAFGLRRELARPIGNALPIAEAACAVALLVQPAGRWGAAAALALLAVFSGGVAVALSNGRTPDCNCFGQVSSAAISWRTLARNGVLAAVSVFALAAGPGASLSRWTHDLTVADVSAGLLCVCAALAVLTAVNLKLQNRRLRVELDHLAGSTQLRAGDTAPDFSALDLAGRPTSLQELRGRGQPVVLVFASPVCGPCQALLPQLARWSTTLGESLTIAVIESGVDEPEALGDQFDAPGAMIVLVEDGFAIPEAYNIGMTPTAVLIDAEGTVRVAAATGGRAIEKVVRSALRQDPTPEFA